VVVNAHNHRALLALATLTAIALAAPREALALDALVPAPWVTGDATTPRETWSGRATLFKAVARGVVGNVRFQWDYGNGSQTVVATAPRATNNDFADIQTSNGMFAQGGDVLIAATLYACDTGTDGLSCDPRRGLSIAYPVIVRRVVTLELRVNLAVSETLWYLHRRLARGVAPGGYRTASVADAESLAATAMVAYAFAAWGHTLDGDEATDPYVTDLKQCLNTLTKELKAFGIASQVSGRNPDTLPNGFGLYATADAYRDGMILLALASAGGAESIVSVNASGNVAGRPLRDVVHDMADFFFWSQSENQPVPSAFEGPQFAGGWRYFPNQSADVAATGWPVYGLAAAESRLGIETPAWVKQTVAHLHASAQLRNGQFPGGATYLQSGAGTTPNVALTAEALFGAAWQSQAADANTLDPAAYLGGFVPGQAWTFVARAWLAPYSFWNAYNIGSMYAMFNVKKAATAFGRRVTCIHQNPAWLFLDTLPCRQSGGHPWEAEYQEYLTGEALPTVGGPWMDRSSPQTPYLNGTGSAVFASAMALAVLAPEPRPNHVPVAVASPRFQGFECLEPGGFHVRLDGTASYDPDPDDRLTFAWQSPAHLDDPSAAITSGFFLTGTHHVPLTVTDPHGASSTTEALFVVSDTRPPVVTCPAVQAAECFSPTGTPVAVPVTATDLCDAAVMVGDDGPELFPVGETLVRYTGVDDANHVASCTTRVVVSDTIEPVLRCPDDVTAECARPTGTPVPLAPFSGDRCDGQPQVVGTARATYPLGETGVEWVATDRAGNVAQCGTLVTIVDTTPPLLDCPDDVAVECAAPEGTPVALAATVADGCDPDVDLVDTALPAYALGATPVSWLASDASGNSNACHANVTVRDTTAPAIDCPADVRAVADAQCVGHADPRATAGDRCDAAPAVARAPAASTWPLGLTAVAHTATDASGNAATCASKVVVFDETAPSIDCGAPAQIGPPDAPVASRATASDNCGAVTPVVTGYRCWKLNGAGRELDATGCDVAYEGDRLTIRHSGGVGTQIEWTVVAADAAGNTGRATCHVDIGIPGLAAQ
jgi:hypothetical protein